MNLSQINLKDKILLTSRLRLVLKLVWKSTPGWTITRIILLFIQGTLPLLSLYLTKLVVDTVAASITATNKTIVSHEVMLLLSLAVVVTLTTILCHSLSELVTTAQSQNVTDYMQNIIHTKAIAVDLEYYENSQYHDTLQRAQQEASYRPNQIINRLAQVSQNGISLLAITSLLFSLYWWFAVIFFLAAIPATLVRLKYARVMYHWQRKRTPIERQAWYFGWLLTSDMSAKEIRLFDLGFLFSQRFRQLRRQIYKESIAIATRHSIANACAQTVAGLVMFGAYAFILHQTIKGILTLGDLALYHQAFQRGRNVLKGFLRSISGLYEDNLFLINLYEFLDLKPKIVDPSIPQPVPKSLQMGIVFNHVSFQYPTTTRKALENISLTIQPGEVIALVGENGSGKTTLIKLLCRLYDPTSGSITLNGIDLRQFETAALRRAISVIFQDYGKYHLSVQENIWLGNIHLSPTSEIINKAAHQSGADDFINSLPKGYSTMLGKWFNHGEELSIGQWQKIALSRAFLRDAQIILLDEPTSALDAQAEHEVFQNFRQLLENQTAILISHRLSTVKMADRIYVMDQGSIIESGTHDELIQLNGTYTNLFDTQARNYR